MDARRSPKPTPWPCVHTHDPGLPEAARASRRLLHCLLVLLGQVEQSVLDRLRSNSSKLKFTARGQSGSRRPVHFQKPFWTRRRLAGPVNQSPQRLSTAFCHTPDSFSRLCVCPRLESEENASPATASSAPQSFPAPTAADRSANQKTRPLPVCPAHLRPRAALGRLKKKQKNVDYSSQRPLRRPKTAIPSKLRAPRLRREERQYGGPRSWRPSQC